MKKKKRDVIQTEIPIEVFARIGALFGEHSPFSIHHLVVFTVSDEGFATICGGVRTPAGWLSSESVGVNVMLAEYVDQLRAHGHLPPAVPA